MKCICSARNLRHGWQVLQRTRRKTLSPKSGSTHYLEDDSVLPSSLLDFDSVIGWLYLFIRFIVKYLRVTIFNTAAQNFHRKW